MVDEQIKQMTPKLDKAVEFLGGELSTIHTGRASTSLVDTVIVEAYGAKQELKQLANISIPEAKQIMIQPWDKGIVGAIEKAIRESDLGFNPVNTGDVVRINIPELTGERRQEFVKIAREKAEEAKVAIRNARQDAVNAIKKAKADGQIGEDDMYRGESDVQKIVERYNKTIEEMLSEKEKELTEI